MGFELLKALAPWLVLLKDTGLFTDFEPLLMNFSYAAYYFYFTVENWEVAGVLSGLSGYPGGGLGYYPDAVYRRSYL